MASKPAPPPPRSPPLPSGAPNVSVNTDTSNGSPTSADSGTPSGGGNNPASPPVLIHKPPPPPRPASTQGPVSPGRGKGTSALQAGVISPSAAVAMANSGQAMPASTSSPASPAPEKPPRPTKGGSDAVVGSTLSSFKRFAPTVNVGGDDSAAIAIGDFGVNVAGMSSTNVGGQRSPLISLADAESFHESGEPRMDMLRPAAATVAAVPAPTGSGAVVVLPNSVMAGSASTGATNKPSRSQTVTTPTGIKDGAASMPDASDAPAVGSAEVRARLMTIHKSGTVGPPQSSRDMPNLNSVFTPPARVGPAPRDVRGDRSQTPPTVHGGTGPRVRLGDKEKDERRLVPTSFFEYEAAEEATTPHNASSSPNGAAFRDAIRDWWGKQLMYQSSLGPAPGGPGPGVTERDIIAMREREKGDIKKEAAAAEKEKAAVAAAAAAASAAAAAAAAETASVAAAAAAADKTKAAMAVVIMQDKAQQELLKKKQDEERLVFVPTPKNVLLEALMGQPEEKWLEVLQGCSVSDVVQLMPTLASLLIHTPFCWRALLAKLNRILQERAERSMNITQSIALFKSSHFFEAHTTLKSVTTTDDIYNTFTKLATSKKSREHGFEVVIPDNQYVYHPFNTGDKEDRISRLVVLDVFSSNAKPLLLMAICTAINVQPPRALPAAAPVALALHPLPPPLTVPNIGSGPISMALAGSAVRDSNASTTSTTSNNEDEDGPEASSPVSANSTSDSGGGVFDERLDDAGSRESAPIVKERPSPSPTPNDDGSFSNPSTPTPSVPAGLGGIMSPLQGASSSIGGLPPPHPPHSGTHHAHHLSHIPAASPGAHPESAGGDSPRRRSRTRSRSQTEEAFRSLNSVTSVGSLASAGSAAPGSPSTLPNSIAGLSASSPPSDTDDLSALSFSSAPGSAPPSPAAKHAGEATSPDEDISPWNTGAYALSPAGSAPNATANTATPVRVASEEGDTLSALPKTPLIQRATSQPAAGTPTTPAPASGASPAGGSGAYPPPRRPPVASPVNALGPTPSPSASPSPTRPGTPSTSASPIPGATPSTSSSSSSPPTGQAPPPLLSSASSSNVLVYPQSGHAGSHASSNNSKRKASHLQQGEYISQSLIIFKVGDDLRRDVLVLQVFHVMNWLWAEEKLKFGTHPVQSLTYGVAAIGKDMGCIEFIRECVPLASIKKVKDWPNSALERMVATAAGSYVGAYILGIRDRHHDNILIKQDGSLFHIDFGHVLGDSVTIDTASFAVTTDLKDVMGAYWEHFVNTCLKAFAVLRKHERLIIEYIDMVFSPLGADVGTDRNIKEFIAETLLLDLDLGQACTKLSQRLRQAPVNIQTRLKNTIHSIALGMKK